MDRHPVLSAWMGCEEMAAILGWEAELAAMLRVWTALAAAQAEAGVLAPEAARAVERACAGFAPDTDALRDGVRRDGVVVPALLAQLRPRVQAPYADALHRGATSQDLVDSALALRLGEALTLLGRRLDAVTGALDAAEARWGDRPLTARTRMRAALPTTVGERVARWRRPLVRARAAMPAEALAVQLGGPIGRDGGSVRAGLAARLGLSDPGASWHTERERLGAVVAWAAGLSNALGKMGLDLGLMAQDEVGEARIAGGGSSAMPHKSNPVDAELLVALARHAATLSGGWHQAIHEGERSGAAWTLEWLTLPPLLEATAAGLAAAMRLLAAVDALGVAPD